MMRVLQDNIPPYVGTEHVFRSRDDLGSRAVRIVLDVILSIWVAPYVVDNHHTLHYPWTQVPDNVEAVTVYRDAWTVFNAEADPVMQVLRERFHLTLVVVSKHADNDVSGIVRGVHDRLREELGMTRA